MARVTRIEYVDDFDGQPIAEGEGETVEFSLGNTRYSIDLSTANAKKLRDAMAPFIAKATKVSSSRRKRSSGSSKSSEINAIREWARANGHEVGERGRIKAEVAEAYRRTVS